jgi:hypothetical protein
MEKNLKKYTTIPEHLYVERNADMQLRSIIKEMQRPGYVLVARQMGKTNLLFNAKRTLENEDRLFVYVDLSNLYDSDRECYRNIINNIIEPNIDLLESIESEIEKIREKNLPAHNEYSRCLRVILNYFKGDLVIILDEIDALKSVDYSDNIFAQIRSNYFSRTNFPVFERLTYVLSGVIEPTELIKDRNKSPFNIGDKIYLDDFTRAEHNIFIAKSKLNISNQISDEIFNWTNGNPRLTFDICSEIEDEILDNNNFKSENLNNIIKKKYLTTFDIAPIDHIRELVKTNKSIRKSINHIHRKQTSEISDDIKKKLYLYGIINSKFEEETKIKNRIIEQSLSEEWIKSIDKDKEISYFFGVAKYTNKEFEEAIEIFENVLLNSNSSKNDIESSTYFAGLSYFKLRNYKKAIEYFEKEFKQDSYSIDAQSYLGISKIVFGNKEEGIKILEEYIKLEQNNYTCHIAILNLALNTEDEDRAFSLFEKLYESTFKSEKDEEGESNQLRTLALYYQANILINKKNNSEALIKINEALKYSNQSDSLYLKYIKYTILEVKDEFIKTDLVETIVNNNLDFDTRNPTPITFNGISLKYYLDFIFDIQRIENFEKLLNYSISELLPNINKFELIYQTASVSKNNKDLLLNYLLNFVDEINEDLLIKTYKELAFINTNDSNKFLEYFNKYLIFFNKNEIINGDDIYLYAVGIKFHYDKNELRQSLDLCINIDNRVSTIKDESLKFEIVIIYYWYSTIYRLIKDKTNSLKYSNIGLDLIENSNRKRTSLFDEEGLNSIKEDLIEIKNQFTIVNTPTNTFPSNHKHQRNDTVKVKYIDGTITENKFKKFENDLKSGKCMIV